MAYMRWHELECEQKKPLDYKIEKAVSAIAEAAARSKWRMALAFSAGKDSTVLADVCRRYLPEVFERLHLIYGNTGVEYPECVKFWERIREEWNLLDRAHVARPERTDAPSYRYEAQRDIWLWAIQTGKIGQVLKPDGKLKSTSALESLAREMPGKEGLSVWPEGTRRSYWWCVDQYGWPLLGKEFSKLLARRINIDSFLRFSKSQSSDRKLLAYYKVLREVKISQACCHFLKHEPAERIQKELGVDVILKGLLASESRPRTKNFLTRGYLFPGAKKDYLGSDPFHHCQPLAIWTDDDIWDYIRRFNVPYASLYDMGYRDRSGKTHKIKRNGCLGCGTDLRFANNHMSVLRRTHPKAWFTFMSRGMAAELQKLQRLHRSGQMSIYDATDPEEIIEMKPCYFDRLKGIVLCDDTAYDPEMR